MIQNSSTTRLFCLDHTIYRRIYRQGLRWLGGYLGIALLALLAVFLLLPTYAHVFTFYLKWQDALVVILCFIALLTLAGATFVGRFLYALRTGYHTGVVQLRAERELAARDLSHENFASIFWMLHAAFWCFIAGMVGLTPDMLLAWTLHLASPIWLVLLTALAVLLSLAGAVVAIIAASFIFVGCIGLFHICRKLGSLSVYPIDNRLVIHRDNLLLTIIYPDKPEALVDLAILVQEDQQKLLMLLQNGTIEIQSAPADLEALEDAEASAAEKRRMAYV